MSCVLIWTWTAAWQNMLVIVPSTLDSNKAQYFMMYYPVKSICPLIFSFWNFKLALRWAATMHWCLGMSCSLTKYERSDGSWKINNSVGTVLYYSAGSNAINLLFVILLLELNSLSIRWAAAVYSDLDTGCSLTKYVTMRNTMMYVVIGDDYWALIGAKLIVI